MTLQPFVPANDVETVIAEARTGRRSMDDILSALTPATLYVSSRSEVQADGTGFEPLLLGEAERPLVAIFTAADRAALHRDRAEYLLEMDGDALFRRLPSGYGAIVNPGFQAQFVVDADAVARSRAAPAI